MPLMYPITPIFTTLTFVKIVSPQVQLDPAPRLFL